MPFALIIIGLVLVVSAARDTTTELYALVKGDFTGPNNYLYWMVSILLIGSLGYIKSLQQLSRLFLALVVTTLLLSRKGFFEQFNAQIFGGSSDATTSDTTAKSSTKSDSWIDNWHDNGAFGIDIPTPLASPRTN